MNRWIGSSLTLCLLLISAPHSFASDACWAVWIDKLRSPHPVTVASPGSLVAPWTLESAAFMNFSEAWKRACWLTRNGGVYGERYEAAELTSGRIVCDDNCNCGL
jgi:hypothetical protein